VRVGSEDFLVLCFTAWTKAEHGGILAPSHIIRVREQSQSSCIFCLSCPLGMTDAELRCGKSVLIGKIL